MTVLYIILLVILAIIGILSVPFHICAEYVDTFVLSVRWAFIKYYIYPPADKKKKKKKEKKKKEEPPEEPPKEGEEKKEEPPKEKGDNFIKTFYNNQGVPGILELLGSIARKLGKGMRGIGRSFYIRKLWLRINVADGNSADTAVKYGKVCTAVYVPLGYILDHVHHRNCSVKINPDFLGSKSEGAFRLNVFCIPSKMIWAGIKMGVGLGIELLKMLISNAKSGAKKQGKTASADNNIQNTGKVEE